MHTASYLASLAGLAALATASPASVERRSSVSGGSGRQNPPSNNLQSFLINYNFETFTSITGQLPVSTTPIGNYDLLNFNTVLVNQTQPPVAGVACHTAPACTVFTLATTLQSGLLTPGQTLNPLVGPAVITSEYQYSPITYFNPCTITATGFNTKGQKIYNQDFQYAATGALLQQMTLGYFNQGWQGLQVARLELTVSNNATTAALVDNFLATVYGPQSAAVNIDF
ncbi:Hypothetical predicted protein [Lecanosticta acicola]|uniref:Uncharacterized protein n=1 Tax=Lecanosticta acicola TaxID=111012 RepID=A0AAI9E7S1_9PEZI|nr:Hypothetical predicted protein [Lecanosticta acicola]